MPPGLGGHKAFQPAPSILGRSWHHRTTSRQPSGSDPPCCIDDRIAADTDGVPGQQQSNSSHIVIEGLTNLDLRRVKAVDRGLASS